MIGLPSKWLTMLITKDFYGRMIFHIAIAPGPGVKIFWTNTQLDLSAEQRIDILCNNVAELYDIDLSTLPIGGDRACSGCFIASLLV